MVNGIRHITVGPALQVKLSGGVRFTIDTNGANTKDVASISISYAGLWLKDWKNKNESTIWSKNWCPGGMSINWMQIGRRYSDYCFWRLWCPRNPTNRFLSRTFRRSVGWFRWRIKKRQSRRITPDTKNKGNDLFGICKWGGNKRKSVGEEHGMIPKYISATPEIGCSEWLSAGKRRWAWFIRMILFTGSRGKSLYRSCGGKSRK